MTFAEARDVDLTLLVAVRFFNVFLKFILWDFDGKFYLYLIKLFLFYLHNYPPK